MADDDDENELDRSTSKLEELGKNYTKVEVLKTLIGVAVSALLGLIAIEYGRLLDRLSGLDTDVKTASINIAALERSVLSLQTEEGYWHSVIEKNRSKLEARPDPFTGTMGRELEERIRKLEKKKP